MACALQMQLFDDGDNMFLGDSDLFDTSVQCLEGELEFQVQSYEGTGDVPVGGSSAAKSFSLTKDSGGSTLSALAVADFEDPDFMDNVSLDDLAAADHYGHTICGRQSTAASTAPAYSSRNPRASNQWTGAALANGEPKGLGTTDGFHGGQESSDCDMSHTHGDGESSGVGPGKSVALGSSHSEASEDNTAGVAPGPMARDEEHISMPSYGLSLSRLTHTSGRTLPSGSGKAEVAQRVQQQDQEARQQEEETEQTINGEHQRMQMVRAFSVDNFALAGGNGDPPASPDSTERLRRAHVYRSYSYVAPDTLPMDFSLGCSDMSGSHFTFGARGRCASLNETQLRRHWLQEGELLAPQLPPSVSELELLELPEDSTPVRPSSTGPLLGQTRAQHQQPAVDLASGSGARSGSMQFKGNSSGGAGSSGGAAALGVTVTVKRKIITSPSPLLQQPKASRTRQSSAAVAATATTATVDAPGATAKVQSPKRPKLGATASASWQDAANAPMSTGVLAGWKPMRQAGAGGAMKTVRSMPANMNSYLDGVEVTVQPLGPPGPATALISPNSSTASAPNPGFSASGQFFSSAGKRLGPMPSVPKPRKRASPNGNPPKAPAPNPNGHCCTQCGTQTTPVWRAGPHGPKTLCNACGVRYMKVAKGNVPPAPRRQQH
ncbi:hypothetical protein Vretimale_1628 [Volvox reticuliferus]|uniref:GATA-type domain-containing protein n=1 Tax=Volvox reticuliferus TaxID=1737510 RepID=A0A8J4CS89_9CHLO|nr:hypothetical protein Vretifemale_15455 [Volvox reticuliferus]GIL95651.1 hypothetical protein Vretimale_1628 [Volvox reticuliferus]